MRSSPDPIKTTVLTDNSNPGNITVKTEQPSENVILEHNQNLRRSCYTGDLTFGRHFAEIPRIILEKWMKEEPVLSAGEVHPDYQKVLMKKIKEHPELLVTDNRRKYI